MRDLNQIYEANILFIKEFPIEKLIKNMKRTAISCILFPKDSEIEAIEGSNNYSIEYIEGNVSKVTIITTKFPWKDYKIELNPCRIIVSQQKGHSEYEVISSIPIEVLRTFIS